MDKKVHYGRTRPLVEPAEDSFDSSWLSCSVSSQYKPNFRLDLSNLTNISSYPSNRTSISQSIEDFSFFKSEFLTPRIVKARHDVGSFATSRAQTNKSFVRNTPRVVRIKNRTVPENILLDSVLVRRK
jgi:hypothetical protein